MENRRPNETEKNYEIRIKLNKLKELAEPLHDWLVENYDPNSMIIIDWDFARVVCSDCGVPLETEY